MVTDLTSPKRAMMKEKKPLKSTAKTVPPKAVIKTKPAGGKWHKIRKMLVERQRELCQQIKSDFGDLQANGNSDTVDLAFDSGANDVNSKLAEQSTDELSKIIAAIKRIDAGTYGICDGCAGKIIADRLEALPFSIHCIKCQSEYERNGEYPVRSRDLPVDLLDDQTDDDSVESVSIEHQ